MEPLALERWTQDTFSIMIPTYHHHTTHTNPERAPTTMEHEAPSSPPQEQEQQQQQHPPPATAMEDGELPTDAAAAAWAPVVPVDMDFGQPPGPVLRPYLQAIDPFRHRRRHRQQHKGGGGGGGGGGCSPNFLKAVHFAPDGTCLLTTSDDAVVRIFELPHHLIYGEGAASVATAASGGDAGGGDGWAPCLACDEGESIYDVAWYPLMYVPRLWAWQSVDEHAHIHGTYRTHLINNNNTKHHACTGTRARTRPRRSSPPPRGSTPSTSGTPTRARSGAWRL